MLLGSQNGKRAICHVQCRQCIGERARHRHVWRTTRIGSVQHRPCGHGVVMARSTLVAAAACGSSGHGGAHGPHWPQHTLQAGLKLAAPVATTTGRQPRRRRAAQPSRPQRHGAPLAMLERPSSHCSAHRRLILHLRSGGILTRTPKHTQQRHGGARFWLAASSRGRRCWQVRLWQRDISRGSLRFALPKQQIAVNCARFMRSVIESEHAAPVCGRYVYTVLLHILHCMALAFFKRAMIETFTRCCCKQKNPRILAHQVRAQVSRLSLSKPTQCAFGSKEPLATTFADWRRGHSAGDSQLLPIAVCAVQSAWRAQEHHMQSQVASCRRTAEACCGGLRRHWAGPRVPLESTPRGNGCTVFRLADDKRSETICCLCMPRLRASCNRDGLLI